MSIIPPLALSHGARHSSTGHPSRVVPGSGFLPPIGNPAPSQNPNMGLLYGWNWTNSVPVSSQAASSSYSHFGPNLGSFNPSGNPPAGGISSFFQPTPMGVTLNPQMPGGSNVPLQQPSLGSRYTPNMPNHNIPSMGYPYQMGGHHTMPQAYPGSYPYNPNQYMGGAY